MPEEITLERVAQSVSELAEAVEESRGEQYDRDKIAEIVTETMDAQRAADEETNRRNGYRPGDDVDVTDEDVRGLRSATPQERAAKIHSRSASRVASVINRSVEQISEFHRAADNLLFVSAALGVDPRETKYFDEEYIPSLRALDTATTAEGTEYVPTGLSASLIERVALQLRVAALFPAIPMPTQPFEIIGRGVSRVRTGKLAQNTADTGQTGAKKITPATRKITLTAVKFAGEMLVSKEAEEDAIIAMLPFMQEELVDFLAADIEDAIINGDTAGSHQDADVTASDDPRKNWNGLRKLALAGAKTDGSNAAPTVAMTRVSRKKLGKYGIQVSDLAHITSMSAYIQLLSDTNVITIDKYGPAATILTGELGKVDGVPVVVSEYVRQDLNATGVQDGVTTNRTETLTVNRRGYLIGDRRETSIQVLRELYAEYDQDAILATIRKAFTPRFPSATETTVAITYNQAV